MVRSSLRTQRTPIFGQWGDTNQETTVTTQVFGTIDVFERNNSGDLKHTHNLQSPTSLSSPRSVSKEESKSSKASLHTSGNCSDGETKMNTANEDSPDKPASTVNSIEEFISRSSTQSNPSIEIFAQRNLGIYNRPQNRGSIQVRLPQCTFNIDETDSEDSISHGEDRNNKVANQENLRVEEEKENNQNSSGEDKDQIPIGQIRKLIRSLSDLSHDSSKLSVYHLPDLMESTVIKKN